ncbi:MAG: tRNA dimethylallyltransferase [Parcubacteria group bacterium ADurb.Bin159]|jgi:tRNA dimethylallyltransferase|nr:MAG: tRNA dimethylallyltransferase [Parcubacteria group bacterium ADurb.Bin159]
MNQKRAKFKKSSENPHKQKLSEKQKMGSDPKLIVILGPTGAGKTALSLKLAKKFNGVIVSADSRAIYKEINIGVAKPPKNSSIPHYMIDIISLNQKFSLAQYQKLANQYISEIIKKGQCPFLVGGTGLYLKSIISNYQIPKVPPDINLRKILEKTALKYGPLYLYQILLYYDPKSKKFIDPYNQRRIIRALEVIFTTGHTFSDLRQSKKSKFDILKIGINLPRQLLYKNIEERTDKMISQGLVEETKKLWNTYPNNIILKNTLGYQEIIPFLENKIELEEAIKNIKKNTKNFARRQITWFKKEPNVFWLNNYKEAEKIIKKFLA